MPYPLPLFVSKTLADQPTPPRQVATLGLIRAVLGGTDCAIYAGAAVVLIAFGLAASSHALPSSNPSSDVNVGLVVAGIGILCALLPAFRIWRVANALKSGHGELAEVVDAQVGQARIYGTPWGDPMLGVSRLPIAARGTYRLERTGEAGQYYMQQRWATALRSGTRIWVLRMNQRDIVYAPVLGTYHAGEQPESATS
jgi:hypothetical protein